MKMQKLTKLFAPTGFKIGLLLTVLSLVIYKFGFPFLNMMELRAYDLHFRYRNGGKALRPGGEVAIVSIDEKSLDRFGRWPWPRTRIAELIDKLDRYGAKVVAFDIVFSEPDHSSGAGLFRDLQARLKDRAVKAALDEAARAADNDSTLAAALARNHNVTLGYFFFASKEEIKHRKEKTGDEAGYYIPSRFTSIRYLEQGIEEPKKLSKALAVEQNIPQLTKAAESFGYFNIMPDEDGTVRWVPLAMRYGGEIYPHLSLEAVRRYLGSPPLFINAAEYGVDSIQVGKVAVPTDEGGRLLVNFRGPERTFPHYSIADVIDGKVPSENLKDKIILVGATSIGIYDMRVTPYSGTFPGVEIHANVIDNILRGDSISRPEWTVMFDVAAILLIGLLLSAVMSRLKPVQSTLFTLVLLAAYFSANQYIFTHWKVWLTAIYPGMTMVLVFGGVNTYRILTEERKKKEIRDAFSRYVAPSLVQDIMKDPAKLVLGGEERRLTIFFSDIRGFTTISEGLEPQVLVRLINDYLTPMTDIVLKHGGTVDKYMGDAIMAFWGAPVRQDDHAVRAARTALEMMERLRGLQAEWEQRGIPRLDIGIGLSTGNVTVGNMGSHLRFDYTVMGDVVNLGSRLEGMNKEYGTHIIVPKYTYEEIKNEFILRQLDVIKVKGKNVPVKIYELMGSKDAGGNLHEAAELFEAGLKAYMCRDWDAAETYFRKTGEALPGDGPSRVFLERIKSLRSADLPADWDGVCVMKTK